MALKKGKEVCTIREAAKLIGYSERQIRQKCIEGELTGAYKIAGGRKWLIPRAAVEQFKESTKRQETAKLEVQRQAPSKQVVTFGQVSDDLLTQERRRKHQNNLLALVESLKWQLAQPLWQHPLRDLGGPGLHRDKDGLLWEVDKGCIYLRLLTSVANNIEERVLSECLFQHLQTGTCSWLVDKMNQWESVGGQEFQERSKLLLALEDLMERWLASPPWASVKEAQGKTDPSFSDIVIAVVVDGVELNYPPVDKQMKSVYRSYCGEYLLATATTPEAVRAYQLVHRYLSTALKVVPQPGNLVTDLKNQGLSMDSQLFKFVLPDLERMALSMQQIRALLMQRGSLCKEIEEGLVEMSLRAYVPGTCRLCPESNTLSA